MGSDARSGRETKHHDFRRKIHTFIRFGSSASRIRFNEVRRATIRRSYRFHSISATGYFYTTRCSSKFRSSAYSRYILLFDVKYFLTLDRRHVGTFQEFSKLFLSKLETTLSYQSAKEVRDLIKDNFCGEYSYVTRLV